MDGAQVERLMFIEIETIFISTCHDLFDSI